MGEIFELILFVEFFLVFPMTSLDCAVPGWFAGVNEAMDDIVFLTKLIKCMNGFDHHITSLCRAGVEVGENATVVCFDGLDFVMEDLNDLFEKKN